MMHIAPARTRIFSPTPYDGVSVAPLASNAEGGIHAVLCLGAGARLPRHTHPGREWIYILEGNMKLNGASLSPGDFVMIDAGTAHEVEALCNSLYLTLPERAGVAGPGQPETTAHDAPT